MQYNYGNKNIFGESLTTILKVHPKMSQNHSSHQELSNDTKRKVAKALGWEFST
jgi:hypothetical protein